MPTFLQDLRYGARAIRRAPGFAFVAIATLAFAYFFDAVMVKFSWVGGNSLLTGTRVPRPVLGPFDFADRRASRTAAVASARWSFR